MQGEACMSHMMALVSHILTEYNYKTVSECGRLAVTF